MIRFCLALAACTVLLSPAAAQSPAPTPSPPDGTGRALLSACLRESLAAPTSCIGAIAVPCVRRAGGNRAEAEVSCARRETALWRERMDAASGVYARALDTSQRSRYAALQRSWEAYTAQKCAFMGEIQPPNRAAAMQAGCDLREVASRSIEIERTLRKTASPSNNRNRPPQIER